MINSKNKEKSSVFMIIVISITLLIIKNDGIMSYCPKSVKTVLLGICSLIIVIKVLKKGDKSLISIIKLCFLLIIFLVYVYIIKMLGGTYNYYKIYINCVPLIIITFLTGYYYFNNNKINEIKIITTIISLDIIYTTINSLIMLIKYPYISRFLATGSDNSYLEGLNIYGVGGYSFFYSLVIIGLILFYFFIYEKKITYKFTYFIGFLLCIIVLLKGSFTISTILLMSFLVKILIEKKVVNRYFRYLIFIIVYISIFMLLPWTLNQILEKGNVSDVYRVRIAEISDSIEGNGLDGDLQSRIERYTMSLKSFTSNILFGSYGNNTIGGHSTWIDVLGLYGLFGLLLVYPLFYRIIMIKKQMPKQYRIFYNNILEYYLILGLINTTLFGELFMTIYVYIPFLIIINNNDNKGLNRRCEK